MTRAVLLDMGNVVIGVDFRKVFRYWAQVASVDERVFHDRWSMDAAYAAHEVGEIDFAEYAAHMSQTFEVSMSLDAWRAGWNAIWTEPFHDVIALLPDLAARGPLYAFTNTNNTHTDYWSRVYESELSAFEHVFVSSHIGHRKPHPEAFAYVCKQMDVSPEEVLFLDDAQPNVDGALEAGLDARLVIDQAAVVAALKPLL